MFDYDKAIAALHMALEASPDNATLREHLADMLLGAGQFSTALTHYQLLVDADGRRLGPRVGLAKALFALGRHQECAAVADALQDEPDCPPEATLIYARIKAGAGDYERAYRAYCGAVEADARLTDDAFARSLREQIAATGRVPIAQSAQFGSDPGADDDSGTIEKPTISFRDVGGMNVVKEAIRTKLLRALTHPEMYRAYGKSTGGGLLLYGPPGVGKTHLARATAGEANSAFISVGISDILDMWLGNSEKQLHAYFERARRTKPCILFFDEIDALGANRQSTTAAARPLVNQFLAELDGSTHANDGVFIIGATNAPWQLDSAFRRPGRFDRIIFVPPPDSEARADILRVLCKHKPVQALDFNAVAQRTKEFSGADLQAVVDLATEGRLREAIEQQTIKPITTRDLLTAAAEVKPSTREWFATARNYAVYSNESGIYDDIIKYLKL